ncbi:unnamed protein product, partial [Polarella glacialis]
ISAALGVALEIQGPQVGQHPRTNLTWVKSDFQVLYQFLGHSVNENPFPDSSEWESGSANNSSNATGGGNGCLDPCHWANEGDASQGTYRCATSCDCLGERLCSPFGYCTGSTTPCVSTTTTTTTTTTASIQTPQSSTSSAIAASSLSSSAAPQTSPPPTTSTLPLMTSTLSMADKDDLEYAKVSVPDLEYAKVSVLDEAEALKGGVVQQSPRAMRNSTRERILHPDEELDHEAEAFDPCVFSLLMANVVQDFTRFSLGTEKKFVRVARLSISLVMVTALIVIQAFLLISVNKLLCASAVSNIRELYSNYEVQMYHNHTVTIFTGKERGIPGYFDATQFYTAFNDEERSTLCQIPLAHLKYISCILMVWTLTCCIELRQVVAQTVRVLFVTPTIASMSLALASRVIFNFIASCCCCYLLLCCYLYFYFEP